MTTTKEITPLFLLSLPRSGSTLLQRILSSYDEISSVAEPWILLPLLYQLKRDGTYTEYSHFSTYHALQDLIEEMPNGKLGYYSAVRTAMHEIYNKIAQPDTKYFLDKTPRYALIADEIPQVFPDSKIIILWRNPLAIIASMVETFYQGKWFIFHSKVDLFDGIENLIALQSLDNEGILVIKYEQLINAPEKELKKITDFLGLKFETSALDNFSNIKYKGKKGDPTGQIKYNNISQDSLSTWKTSLSNPWRKRWCRKYLRWLGNDRLLDMGYSLDDLITELDSIPNQWDRFFLDVMQSIYGELYCVLELKILKDTFKRIFESEVIKKHD